MENKSVKILHCADLHIGSSFSSLDGKSALRKIELLATFDTIIDICNEKEIDFLLVAGDLFDKVNIDEREVDHIIGRFMQLSDTFVFISPGNHDPFSADSFYMLKKWPENVHIFNGKMSEVFIKEKNTRICGAGFTSTYSKGLLESRNYTTADRDSDIINICVLHGELTASHEKSYYNPIAGSEIENSGFDYIALGHAHCRTPLQRAGKTFFAYPGPPEGMGFDEQGEMGVYVGTVSKDSCDLEFVETSKRRFKELNIDIGDCFSNEDAYTKCILAIKQTEGEIRKNDFYKIILKGEVSQDYIINTGLIESKILEMVYFAKIKDSTREKLDLEKIASDETLKGIYAKKLLKELNLLKNSNNNNNYSNMILEKAVRYGMAAFSGEVVPDEY